MRKVDLEISFTGLDGREYLAGILVTSNGTKGCYSGPPESCYPAEDPEMEIARITQEDGDCRDVLVENWSGILDDSIEAMIIEKAVVEDQKRWEQ